MPRLQRNNALMLNLIVVSLFCLLVLVGLFIYRGGSLLPSTHGADKAETAQIWIMWGVVVAVPLITGVLWVFRVTKPSGD